MIEARLVKQRRSLHLRLRGDDRLAVWSLERRISDGAFRRAFGRRLVRQSLSAARSSSHSAT